MKKLFIAALILSYVAATAQGEAVKSLRLILPPKQPIPWCRTSDACSCVKSRAAARRRSSRKAMRR